jgi:prepilin peptidase CpaA
VTALIDLLLAALLLFACITDLTSLRIPNKVTVAVAALFIPFAIASGMTMHDALLHLAAGFGVLMVGFVLFSLGLKFGGGDVKLLSALCLWCGVGKLLALFVAMSLAGGLLAMLIFLLRQSTFPLWLAAHGWNIPALAIARDKPYVPYAPAIAFGYLAVRYWGMA